MTAAEAAPGFNHSLACMVAAVGVGHVVAAQYGPAARPAICMPPIFHVYPFHAEKDVALLAVAMNLTWSILGLLTCVLTPLDWNLGSATLLMAGLNHAAFSAALWGRL